MTVIAVTSARSSPGATSIAVGLSMAWKHQSATPLLVEADPAGGVIGLRFDLAAEPSLVTMSADIRRGYDPRILHENTIDLGGVQCLLSPVDPVISARVIGRNRDVLSQELPTLGMPTVIDVGRAFESSPSLPLCRMADQVLVVARPRVDEIQALLFTIRQLRSMDCPVSLVLIGDRPHFPEEVAKSANIALAGVIPDDRALAGAFSGGRYSTRRLQRSLLWRSITELAQSLLGQPQADQESPPPTTDHQLVREPTAAELASFPPPVAVAGAEPVVTPPGSKRSRFSFDPRHRYSAPAQAVEQDNGKPSPPSYPDSSEDVAVHGAVEANSQ